MISCMWPPGPENWDCEKGEMGRGVLAFLGGGSGVLIEIRIERWKRDRAQNNLSSKETNGDDKQTGSGCGE